MLRKAIIVLALLEFAVAVMAQPNVVAYVPNWVDLNTFSEQINYAKLTHINIAFENPTNAAGDMAYDAVGPWSPQSPGQHSSYDFATNNVAYWLARGLPKSKAVLGVPFYGYGFGQAFRKRDYSYKAILAEYRGAEESDQIGSTIWYNGMATVEAKSQFVKSKGLGGIMIWSLDYDVNDERSLLSVIHRTLTAGTNSASGRP